MLLSVFVYRHLHDLVFWATTLSYNLIDILHTLIYQLALYWCLTVGSSNITHPAQLRPEDVLKTSPNDVLRTSQHGPLCNAKGRFLPTSWELPLPTSSGRWNMTSWERPSVASWGRPHTGVYITPWNVPYRHFLQTLCGCPHTV